MLIVSMVAMLLPAPIAVAASPVRWTIADIVTAPVVTDMALSPDGALLLVIRQANMEANRVEDRLVRYDPADNRLVPLFSAPVIEQVRPMIRGSGWSALIDRGDGVQLYRIRPTGHTELLARNDRPVWMGEADGAVRSSQSGAPRRVGVLSYAISPDGRWLWTSQLQPAHDPPSSVRNDALVDLLLDRRSTRPARIAFYLGELGGPARQVAIRPTNDRVALYFGGSVRWAKGELRFSSETGSADQALFQETRVSLADGAVLDAIPVASPPFATVPNGPSGGRLSVSGEGTLQRLIEAASAGTIDHGEVGFRIADHRGAGQWQSEAGRVVFGIRMLDRPRYGLGLLDPAGVRTITSPYSLTRCDLSPDLLKGYCIEEGLALAPRLVRVDLASAAIEPLVELSDRHRAIVPLRVTAGSWTSDLGFRATGYLVWPRHHPARRRAPLIVVTHGSDADERFARDELQWNYPVQVWAERGHFVLLINDPSPFEHTALAKAYAAWGTGDRSADPASLRQHLWIDPVSAIGNAIDSLARDGLIDPDRVGIAGFSRGAQIVTVALSQTGRFKAGSAGDGGYLEPIAYPWQQKSYDSIYGGAPFGQAMDAYRSLAPSLRADLFRGVLLQQVAKPSMSSVALYQALKAANKTSRISLYRGSDWRSDETHLFHLPRNRLCAMTENLAWFDAAFAPSISVMKEMNQPAQGGC
ncbi:prolyl oligopeptidase family serine peptidase [Sphingomonas sp. FW199]|uniref:prolyl oligopeptidase family serine peptidase n=1 Tax=Sphingomonas sp. FW199 TaxID=3400217 RepID=UPI003CFBAD9C